MATNACATYPRRMNVARVLLPFILACSMVAMAAACSDDDATPGPTGASSSDGASTADGASSIDGSGLTPDGAPPGSDASADAGGKGFHVTEGDGGGAHDLTQTPSAKKVANGYGLSATSTDNGMNRSITIILRKFEPDSGLSGATTTPIPGKYVCQLVNQNTVIQYNVGPAGSLPTYRQTDLGSTCEVDVTEFGAVGGAIKGTFSGSLPKVGAASDKLDVTGSFDLVRQD